MNILIVEDEPALQDMIHLYLTDYGTCDIAANGIEALAAVEQMNVSSVEGVELLDTLINR